MNIRPVILAGGEGKRLAPLSTPTCPKPFIPLPDGQSLLEKTFRRLQHPDFLPPIVVGNVKDRFAILNHARAAGVVPEAILLEDTPRNTAFAVAAAVHYITLTTPDVMLAFLPADHVIEDLEAWQKAVIAAAGSAQKNGALALLSMEYETFSPGLGYMSVRGEKVAKFIEKPASESELPVSGNILANSVQFIGTSTLFSAILAENCPKIWQISQKSISKRQKRWEYDHLYPIKADFIPISFDKAVLEAAENIVSVRVSCGWRDLGTLEDWLEYTKIPMNKQLDKKERMDRPWGYYEVLEQDVEQSIKRLFVFPGCRLSRQRHFYRSEHWTVESGTAYIERDLEKFTLGIYESIKIPPAAWHRLVNPTADMLIIKEIQYGISDESDIEREEDDYGRI